MYTGSASTPACTPEHLALLAWSVQLEVYAFLGCTHALRLHKRVSGRKRQDYYSRSFGFIRHDGM